MRVLLAASPIIFLVTLAAKGPGFHEMEACSLLVNLRKGMQSSSKQPLVGEENCVTTLITAAKETINRATCKDILEIFFKSVKRMLRFITISCYENGWEEHFVALLFDFVRFSKFSAHKFYFFLCGLNEGKGIDQEKCQAILFDVVLYLFHVAYLFAITNLGF